MRKQLFGLDETYGRVKATIEFMWNPEFSEKRRFLLIQPTILLKGPPGTGKTSLIANIANFFKKEFNEEGFYFHRTNLNNLISHNLGQSSKNLIDFFSSIQRKAEQGKRVMVHLDDAESALSSRLGGSESKGIYRFVTTALEELDKLFTNSNEYTPVLILSTNSSEVLDPAVMRRFTHRFEINPKLSSKEVELMCMEYLELNHRTEEIVDFLSKTAEEHPTLTPHTYCRILEATLVQDLDLPRVMRLTENELENI